MAKRVGMSPLLIPPNWLLAKRVDGQKTATRAAGGLGIGQQHSSRGRGQLRASPKSDTEARAPTGESIYIHEVRAPVGDTSRRSEADGKAVVWSTRRQLWSGGYWEKEPWRAAAMVWREN